jgi:predicted ATPase
MTQLRAATRLGGLSLARGEPDAAARRLGPIYATFTEGLSTADLLEARGVLAAITPGGSPGA